MTDYDYENLQAEEVADRYERAIDRMREKLKRLETEPKLDELCQLHERIEVLYEVDQYKATLFTHDGDVAVVSGVGRDVLDAMRALARAAKDHTLPKLRDIWEPG